MQKPSLNRLFIYKIQINFKIIVILYSYIVKMPKTNIILKLIGRLLLHLLFWCIVLLFFTYFFGAEKKNYSETLLFSLFLMPITIATTYVSIYKLIPDYLITKRYFLFALYSLYTIIISGYLIILSIFFSLMKPSSISPLLLKEKI